MIAATQEPHRIGDLRDVVAGALDFYNLHPDKAAEALSLLRCHTLAPAPTVGPRCARPHHEPGCFAAGRAGVSCEIDGEPGPRVCCPKMATNLYGTEPYSFAPHCDEHGDPA